VVQAIREIVKVGEGGLVQVRVPESHQGDNAEVIVLIETRSDSLENRRASLDALQRSLKLDLAAAQEWARRADLERKASSRM
jgi:hypothetical protein